MAVFLFFSGTINAQQALSVKSISVQEFDSKSGRFYEPNPKMYFFNPHEDFVAVIKLSGFKETGYETKGVSLVVNYGGKVKQFKSSGNYFITNSKGDVYLPFYLGDSSVFCNNKNTITASINGTSNKLKADLGVDCGE